MTVQIVSRPKPMLVVCGRCECELSYTKLDIQTHYPRIPEFSSYDYIDCPNCDNWVTIEKNQPPRSR